MKKKKVGILTFHDADNLGAVLQAFALKNVLENECKVSAEIVDYKCKMITDTKYAKKSKGIKGFIKYVLQLVYYAIKRRGFDSFREKQLGCSKQSFTKESISESDNIYDFFITGSDQIWNPQCSDSDQTYLLDFVKDKNKKYSYAASIGNYEFSDSDFEWLELIKDYKRISVRENSAAIQLEKSGIESVSVNCDPVFLLTDEQWKAVMNKRIVSSKYVLVYLVLPDVNVMKQAKEYAAKHGCRIISNKQSFEFFLHNSPADFLSWIYHAECVFTNSFHGTAFSLIFNKPLFADIEMANKSINHRVNDLLIATASSECAALNNEYKSCAPEAKGNIEDMRKQSINYLKEICNDV